VQVLGYAGVVTLLVAAVSIWAVGAVTRPLERLTTAGGQLARDIATATPIDERGPAEVRTLAAGFNTMQRAVQAQLRERTFILGAISHDLKTPLTRLKLRLSDLPADAPREAINADLDAMGALIDEGLDYARSTQLREARVPLDLVGLLEGMVDDASDLGQPVQLASVVGPVTVCAAPRALTRLLQNLIDNALRYGGCADLSVHILADQVEVQVADHGPGIPPEDRERMFEPFVRGESSRGRDSGGTGLGLAIARNIAVAHGGRVWLSERPHGGGLVAHLALPRPAPA
jgi:protein-histidine pros-kinase